MGPAGQPLHPSVRAGTILSPSHRSVGLHRVESSSPSDSLARQQTLRAWRLRPWRVLPPGNRIGRCSRIVGIRVVIAGDQRNPDFPSYLTRGRRGIGTARLAHSLTAWWALKHQDVFPAWTPHLARNPAWLFAASIRPDSGYLYRGCCCLSNHLSHLSELCNSYPSRAHLVAITGVGHRFVPT